MNVERVKYLIWAADVDRAVLFYETLFGAKVTRQNPAVTDSISVELLLVFTGGEGNALGRLSFQVADVAAAEVASAGGILTHEPREENGEPPHLAMCADTEGNEFMPRAA